MCSLILKGQAKTLWTLRPRLLSSLQLQDFSTSWRSLNPNWELRSKSKLKVSQRTWLFIDSQTGPFSKGRNIFNALKLNFTVSFFFFFYSPCMFFIIQDFFFLQSYCAASQCNLSKQCMHFGQVSCINIWLTGINLFMVQLWLKMHLWKTAIYIILITLRVHLPQEWSPLSLLRPQCATSPPRCSSAHLRRSPTVPPGTWAQGSEILS